MKREEVVNAAIIEEVRHFDAELREVFNSVKNIDINVSGFIYFMSCVKLFLGLLFFFCVSLLVYEISQ